MALVPENIQKVLLKNNNNMRQTALDIGCTQSVIRRFCIRNNIDITDNMKGENNPKRIASIKKHAELGIDISADNIKKVFAEQNNNVAKTAKAIGCTWSVINSFCVNNDMFQKSV